LRGVEDLDQIADLVLPVEVLVRFREAADVVSGHARSLELLPDRVRLDYLEHLVDQDEVLLDDGERFREVQLILEVVLLHELRLAGDGVLQQLELAGRSEFLDLAERTRRGGLHSNEELVCGLP